MDVKEFLKNHFDFNFYPITVPAVICLLSIVPCVLSLPEKYGFENGIIENIQMVVLLITFIFCIKAKQYKKLFIFMALVILLLALREVNYGRTIFFPVPGQENMYYSWKDIKYGFLVHPFVAVYIISSLAYFAFNKLYFAVWEIFTKIKLPVLNISLMAIGICLGVYAEKYTHSFVFEEMAELLFYLSLSSIIYLYAFNKNFR